MSTEEAMKESTTTTSQQPHQDSTTPGAAPELDENGFPKAMLDSGICLYGSRFPKGGPGGRFPNAEQRCRDIREMEIRHDDVIVCAYMKCGTHWLWEVTRMLLSRDPTISTKVKEFNMLEAADLPELADCASPRVLNSHLWTCHLPQQIFEKKVKIIHVVRNPKDVVTSFYYHTKRRQDYDWGIMLKYYMANKLSSPHLLAYLKHMQDFQQQNPDHPVATVCYEDMIKNPVDGISRLADFLCVPGDVTWYQQVAEACHFDNMKTAEKDRKYPDHHPGSGKVMMKQMNFYRKGKIGDWKNHFTVAQNEAFDEFLSRETQGLPYSFVYDN